MRAFSVFLILFFSCASPKDDTLTIACAANLETGIDSIAKSFQEFQGVEVEVVSGASGTLATQIRSGAPFDLFISADKELTDQLNADGFTSSSELYRRSEMICLNHTEYVGTDIPLLLRSEHVQKIGIADPEVAPFGKAAKDYLESIDLWDDIESKIVYAESVSQLNMYIESYSVDVAFTSLSFISQKEFAYNFIHLENHPDSVIEQFMVEVDQGNDRHPDIKKLHDYMYSEEALKILEYFGY